MIEASFDNIQRIRIAFVRGLNHTFHNELTPAMRHL
jgi:hypothetical protein